MKKVFTAIGCCIAALASAQKVHQADNLRIFYDISGQHAVDLDDVNSNGIPDQVEDVMTQVRAARMLFVDVLGFPEPLKTERFRQAAFIDIHFRNKEVLKMNGVAYDELQRFNKPGDPARTLSICFNVATSVKAPVNLTPAHEFFHLIQYSTTYFKNRWFLEGTARWSEHALGSGHLGPARIHSSWPLTTEKANTVFGMAYEASEHFWNPLASKLDSKGIIPDAPALQLVRKMTYSDGSPVMKDVNLTGWEFVRDVLIELGKTDDITFREQGYDRWSEENQRSPKNDNYLLRVVEEVVKRHQP